MTMIDGKKSDVPGAEALVGSKPMVGIFFLAIIATIAIYLVNNFDSQDRTLRLFGATLHLGDDE